MWGRCEKVCCRCGGRCGKVEGWENMGRCGKVFWVWEKVKRGVGKCVGVWGSNGGEVQGSVIGCGEVLEEVWGV